MRRLSYAVSKVSVKDFRLPLDERPLPLELRPIAGRLTTTLDLLKRAFAREKQAVADISHELRTPLAALLTTTEFGLRKPRAAEQYRELLSSSEPYHAEPVSILDIQTGKVPVDAEGFPKHVIVKNNGNGGR